MILKLSNIFVYQEPHDPNNWFTKCPRLSVSSVRAFTYIFMLINKDDTLADSSGTEIKDSF